MPVPTITSLNNAALDVAHISTVATSTALTATDRLGNVKQTIAGAVESIKAFNNRGAWAAATVYASKDLVSNGGNWYVCVLANTSGATFAGDEPTKWRVYQGVAAVEFKGSLPVHRSSRPAFHEQHITGFKGRGMLTAEAINVITEQAFVGTFAAGATTLVMTSAAQIVVGGCVTVKHDNGKYGTYFVDAKSGNNIGIRPGLLFDCLTASAKIERTWFNRAHPGKFYMRQLAQRIAHSTELEAAMPDGNRLAFTNVASNPNTLEDTLVSVGGAAINYFAASNLGEDGTAATPVRFALGRSAYVDGLTAVAQGVETQSFDVVGAANAVAKVTFLAAGLGVTFAIEVVDENGRELGKLAIPVAGQRIMQIYTVPCDVRHAKRIKVRILSESFTTTTYFVVDQVDVFSAPDSSGKVIANPAAKIVCLGDSWIQGDLGSTPEREPITAQLALELPYATIINSGVGGNTISSMLARFDADVAAHKPDYVVVNTGTNEAYNPLSGVFEPNAVDEFLKLYRRLIQKIIAIGARPIIIGVPALAQTDADVPAFAEWLLNDRAKSYARYFFEEMSRKPSASSGTTANGTWVKLADGTLICRHQVTVTTTAALTLASTTWTFPVPFIAAPTVCVSPANYDSNQILSGGSAALTTGTASIRLVSGTGAIAVPMACIAVGRWYA